jgi:2-C-methyl-D-erythritol 2,4-cyclodiphosphate synthase
MVAQRQRTQKRGLPGRVTQPAFRVGFGYDVHRCRPARPGRALKLGGVAFPRAGFSLEGHSDADVLLHAACDALLGAAGLADIGTLFPNTDSRNRGRNSLEFLSLVGKQLLRRGFHILNLDCTLVAEAPKIMNQVPLMRRRIARALNLHPGQVAVKATTNEGLGALGRKEGLAAFAVALVQNIPSGSVKKS